MDGYREDSRDGGRRPRCRNRAVDSAAEFGIIPRIPDALDFARRSRVLLMRHVASGIDLDVMLGALPFEQSAVEHSVVHDIGGLRVRLPRIEDLLVMKAVAPRSASE